MIFPSTACIVQDKLGASNAAAFDIYHLVDDRERIDEAGAHRLNIEGSGIAGTELVLQTST